MMNGSCGRPHWLALALLLSVSVRASAGVPSTLEELWRDYPTLEASTPLQPEVLQEWTEGDVICRVVRFQVGVFKGAPSRVAGFYAFPKGGQTLPALLGIHGGGHAANLDHAVLDARRGYASLSLNWGGNPLRFGRSKATYSGPQTDWGRLDATHPPQRNKVNHFAGPLTPDEFTLDAVESPRNSNWFVVLMAARRAITFLQQQPEVDGTRIGVYGHSMGGKLTTCLAGIDSRVKAAVPSCGGAGDIDLSQTDLPGCVRKHLTELERACVSDNAYIPGIRCPMLWLSPTNDFHAPVTNMAWNWRELPDSRTRFSISPHFDHRHGDAHQITQYLWFEQHLRGKFTFPASPQLAWQPATQDGVPRISVAVDRALPVKNVEVYYSSDPEERTRFWRSAEVEASGDGWTAACPLLNAGDPLFAYADVHYELPAAYRNLEQAPGNGPTDAFALSSRPLWATPRQLAERGAKATDHWKAMIDDGTSGWRDWYRVNWDHAPLWKATTRKLKDPKWRGPDGATLRFELTPEADNTVVITLSCNDWGAFVPGAPATTYSAAKEVRGGQGWQTILLRANDFLATSPEAMLGQALPNWNTITELSISPSGDVNRDGVRHKIAGESWQGAREIRDLRWELGEN